MREAESIYHLHSDLLARSQAELRRAYKSVPSLEYSLRGMRVQKESYVEKFHELLTVAAHQEENSVEEEKDQEDSNEALSNDIGMGLSGHLEDLRAPSRNLEERIALKKKIVLTQDMIASTKRKLVLAQKVQQPILFNCPRCGWGGGLF